MGRLRRNVDADPQPSGPAGEGQSSAARRSPGPAAGSVWTANAAPGKHAAPDPRRPTSARWWIENRIEELAQTKVEASQKFPIRITGMALFQRFSERPLQRRRGESTDGFGDAWRDDRRRHAPAKHAGAAVQRARRLFGAEKSVDRCLHGFLRWQHRLAGSLCCACERRPSTIDWKNTSVMLGQDKPIISPRDPDSLAQVGYSPLSGAGNLWLWQPQVRLEQRFSWNENTGLRAQAGVVRHQLPGLSDANSEPVHDDLLAAGILAAGRGRTPGMVAPLGRYRARGNRRRLSL